MVTDTTPSTMEVRALVTAKDADDIWTVRAGARADGHLAAAEHPYALPRLETAPAPERGARLGKAATRDPAGTAARR